MTKGAFEPQPRLRGRGAVAVLYTLRIAPSVQQEVRQLPPRIANAALALIRKMRQGPDEYGLSLVGSAKGLYLAKRPGFQIIYRVNHHANAPTVDILSVEPR